MFIGGTLMGIGFVGMCWVAVAQARREASLLQRVKTLEGMCTQCSTSES